MAWCSSSSLKVVWTSTTFNWAKLLFGIVYQENGAVTKGGLHFTSFQTIAEEDGERNSLVSKIQNLIPVVNFLFKDRAGKHVEEYVFTIRFWLSKCKAI